MITVGTVTMSSFGWVTLTIEAILIWVKDCSLWFRHLNYRSGMPGRLISALVGIGFAIEIAAAELLALADKKQYATLGIVVLLVTLALTTTDGVETLGRQCIWWIGSYSAVVWVTLFPQIPSMAAGSRSYYQTPGRVIPNLILMVLAFVIYYKIWHSHFVKIIPPGVCCGFAWISMVANAFMLGNIDGDERVTLGHVMYVVLLYAVIIGCYSTALLLCRQEKQHKLQMEQQCRREFYSHLMHVKKQAGSFRHDLANHLQVIRSYEEAGWEEEQKNYLAKLSRQRAELLVTQISGDRELDFMLNQLKSMGEVHQITLKFDWQVREWQQDRKEEIVGRLLNWMSSIYHHRNRDYLIHIYDRQGKVEIFPVRCKREG